MPTHKMAMICTPMHAAFQLAAEDWFWATNRMDTGSGLASVENLKQQQNFGHHFQVAVYRQQQDKNFHYMYIYALAATYFVTCCYAMRIIEAGGDNMAMGCFGNQQHTTNQPQNRHFMHPKLMLVCMYVALFLGTWNESTLYWDAGIVCCQNTNNT